jgi:hypothetical protein
VPVTGNQAVPQLSVNSVALALRSKVTSKFSSVTWAHISDASTVATLDTISTKCTVKGTNVEIIGLNEASEQRHERLSGHLAGAH